MANILFYCIAGALVLYLVFDLIYLVGSFIASEKQDHLTDIFIITDRDVTIQVPVFNSGKAVLPLLEALKSENIREHIPFPVQLLDSSSDDTTKLIEDTFGHVEAIDHGNYWIKTWNNIQLIHFKQKLGHKAWALKEGIRLVETPFVAVFDADAKIDVRFFERLLPIIQAHPKVGYIQASWQSKNENENFISYVDTVSLETEHRVEDIFRNHFRIPFTIHGSAFIARTDLLKQLEWRDEFLSEDVDLAMRINCNGYYGIYAGEQRALGSACSSITQFFKQKRRWIEGRSQMARVHLRSILRSNQIPWLKKIFVLHYLLYFMRFPLFVLLLIVSAFLGTEYLFFSAMIASTQVVSKTSLNLRAVFLKKNRIYLASLVEPILFWIFLIPYSYRTLRGFTLRRAEW